MGTNLPAWSLPTNLVVEPLIGLTLIRGLGPVLRDADLISSEMAGLIPPQLVSWQRAGPPLQVHFAMPDRPAAGLFVKRYLPACLEWLNTHLEASKFGRIITNESAQEFRWDGLSLAVPCFRTITNGDEASYHLGFGMLPPRSQPLAQELRDFATTDAGTIFFEWEYTAETISNWRYLDDISRMIFDAAHIPRVPSGSAAIDWIKNNRTNLSHTISRWRFEDQNTLTFKRKSTVGLNGLELAILAHWLELPEFPAGLNTIWQPNSAPYLPRRSR